MVLGVDTRQTGCRLGEAELFHVECDGLPCLTLVGSCCSGELRGLIDSWCAMNPVSARRAQRLGVVLNLERLQLRGELDDVDLLGAQMSVAGFVGRGEFAGALRALAVTQLSAGLLRGVFTSSDPATEWVRERAEALRRYRQWQAA